MAELKVLVHLRGQAKAKVTRIRKAVEDGSGAAAFSLAFPQLKVMQRNLEQHFQEYLGLHHQIMGLIPPEKTEEHDETYLIFENHHNETSILVESMIESMMSNPPFVDQAANTSVCTNSQPPQIVVQQQPLPVPIPTFDGKPENWPRFKATFLDIISRSRDSDAIKLHHLEKALVGAASDIIDVKTLSDNNYAHAWDLLVEAYEDERKLVDTHIQGLLSLKRMKSESSKQLKDLIKEVTRHIEGLKLIGQVLNGISQRFVVNLLASAMDPETRKQWESTIPHKEIPTYEATIQFLKERCSLLERCEASLHKPTKEVVPVPKPATRGAPVKSFAATSVSSVKGEPKCEFCGGNHANFKCESFRSLSVPQRVVKVRELSCCFNCLRKGHRSAKCPSDRVCQQCQGRHHSLLHDPKPSNPRTTPVDSSLNDRSFPSPVSTQDKLNSNSAVIQDEPVSLSVQTSCAVGKSRIGNTLLLTAMVNVLDKHGLPRPCRVLLDSGSEINLVSRAFADTLAVTQIPTNVEVIGANGKCTTLSRKVVLNIQSLYINYNATIECLVTEAVTGKLPCRKFDTRSWNIPPGIQLADPQFHTPNSVDLLLGIRLFFQLMLPGQLTLKNELPILKETRLGWVVAGHVEELDSLTTHCYVACYQPLEDCMQKFWAVESVECSTSLTNEERNCEDIFLSTTKRASDGRYIVHLPLKESACTLPNNRSLALKRFYLLERRFQKNPELKDLYVNFINEYKNLNHCKIVNEKESSSDGPSYYLPHHAILKPTSSTTQLRVVFDGSSKSIGPSLNEVMMVGPVVQNDLFSISLRFRRHRYAFTADIAKMYRQIQVDPKQTCLQRIFWRENPNDSMQVIELTTVTYGTACAPYLATRTLMQLARDEKNEFPKASKIVELDFYVDDVLTGADSIAEAIESREELTRLLIRGGFQIHKWCANEEDIIRTIPEERREKLINFEGFHSNQVIKALGLLWDPQEDVFLFHSTLKSSIPTPTKRNVLSEIASIFDAIGLASPVIVIAKCIMQRLWISGLGWDDILDGDLLSDWLEFRDSLKCLNQLKIPRCFALNGATLFEIHGFADASTRAYGACIYIRSISTSRIHSSLLCSKSKIAPIKPLTIPRLELCASTLLSRLIPKVLQALNFTKCKVVLWSDSQIVLAWLKKSPHHLPVFVRNRVTEIQNTTEAYEWNYVQSELNPADIVSRGQSPKMLASNDLWWKGPPFLVDNGYDVEIPVAIPDNELPEYKICVTSTITTRSMDDFPCLTVFSSFRRLQRVFAWMLRFKQNCRSEPQLRIISESLTIPELRAALITIIKIIQRIEFAIEINQLTNGEHCRRLASLNPTYENGLLRVGGRISNSNLPYDAKHQIILPNKNKVTKLLIQTLHEEQLHIGPSGLFSMLRQRYWILNARSTVRGIIRRCVTCFRSNPKCLQPIMGQLPESRVVPSLPFSKTGIDFAGPVFIRHGIRKPMLVKAYICVFICLVTKAIHLELVSDLTSAAFIAALRRFVSRRGLVEEIISDNGTNFVGAKSELHDLYLLFKNAQEKGKIDDFCQTREIVWRFIPPRSPNFGGLWEAGVKSTKSHLRKILSNAALTYEEYYTILTQIEAILNSRPLFAYSPDPNEPLVITPGHFLIGRPLNAIPEPTEENSRTSHLSRWKYLQNLRDHFWRRWSREYLNTLQSRCKWNTKNPNVSPGLIVLLKEDNLPSQSWKLAVVEKIFPGPDSNVRVVDVKTSTGIFRRPVSRLAPLPIEDNVPFLRFRNLDSNPGENVRSCYFNIPIPYPTH